MARPPAPDAVYSAIEQEFISGNLSHARKQSEEAYGRFKPDGSGWNSIFLVELAKVLVYQGESGRALSLLEPPLAAHPGMETGAETEVRRKLILSIAQVSLGHPDEAEATVHEAELECGGCVSHAEILNAEGIIDINRNKLDEAERVLQTSLREAGLNKDRFLQTQTLMNLGVVALREDHYEDAAARFGNASALARSVGAKLALEKAVGNLGWIYYKTGDFPRALASYKEAEEQATELGVPKDQVLWLNNVGQSESRLGEVDAARLSYERSLSLAQSIEDQNEILILHVDLGYLLLQLGNPAAAETHIREATRMAAVRNNRAQLDPMLLQALLLDARGDKEGAARTLVELDKRGAELPSVQWDAESNLARIYSETGRQAEADRWFRRSIDTFQHSRASLSSVDSTLPFLANGADLYTGYSKYLIDRGRAEEALSVIDESRAESLEDGLHLSRGSQKKKSSQELNARAIAARLQATILVYSLRPKISYLWAITPTRQQFYQIAGSETILPLVQAHTKMILASRDLLAQANAPGRSLYKELVEPAQDLIKKGSRIFIVGDDALSGLNFDTLQTPGDDSHYWIEDVAITNAKSLQLLSLREPKEARYGDRRILLIGDPVYRKDEFAELPNASAEMTEIASHFSADRREVFTGAEASPEAYQRSRAGEFSYIHFVAHGTANMTSPLDSAVVLSKDRDDATVYKLYARDILKQNLHADLVTVSACNGSGVRNYSGEGLVGLAWAFLRAGSHHVIGAMWEVSDVSTPLLMDHLYGELEKGSEPDAALRSAKLAMIHTDGVFRKPLYWAAFQLYSGA
ncbi:MAG TPA: CHAT domain-containing protein [Edaphobacter sp.]|nr:CHAT domain-containing protein [Edaphobacter sp.]